MKERCQSQDVQEMREGEEGLVLYTEAATKDTLQQSSQTRQVQETED